MKDMAADFEKAKKTAAEILRRYDLTDPPVDPRKIAEAEGIKVYYAKFSENLKGKVSGYFHPTMKTDLGMGAIIINHDISTERKIFTIAHELGHVLMHNTRANDKITEVQDMRSIQYRMNNYTNSDKPDNEKEADTFAANLLMPAKWVAKFYFMLKEVGKKPTPQELASYFSVSTESMKYRLMGMDFE